MAWGLHILFTTAPLSLFRHLCYCVCWSVSISYHPWSLSVPEQLVKEVLLSRHYVIKASFRKIACYLYIIAWAHNNAEMCPYPCPRPISLGIFLDYTSIPSTWSTCVHTLWNHGIWSIPPWLLVLPYKERGCWWSLLNVEGLGSHTVLSFGCKISAVCSIELNLWFKHLEHKHKVLSLLSISILPILRSRSLSLALPQPFGFHPITAHSNVI